MTDVPVVTVDGPSGSGKGTLAALLAKHFGWHLLDSGALYRIVAAIALERGIDLSAAQALAQMARGLDIRFENGQVVVDGVDLTDRIRHEEVGEAASRVAACVPVREAILDSQHSMRKPPGLVADGRDMGTVVFPDATAKIYLEASAQVRAERRYKQLKNKGLSVSVHALLATIIQRDERDTRRAASPLRPAKDAIIIESTSMSIEKVLEVSIAIVEQGLAST
ncbi:MAG: (d)CMP kinase [Proteobacteria bacterium]|nr:(d)CMP kinase [Pseudomonadota bacterium]